MSKKKIYPEVCPMELDEKGGHYFRHVDAMTGEGLHCKGDIACQLGYRDMKIQSLQEQLKEAKEALQKIEKLERREDELLTRQRHSWCVASEALSNLKEDSGNG